MYHIKLVACYKSRSFSAWRDLKWNLDYTILIVLVVCLCVVLYFTYIFSFSFMTIPISQPLLSSQESLQQQHLMGVVSQTPTGTGTPASLATPPTTVHPVRQTSIAPPQHLKSQRSINTPATATPPKVRPQSRNLLLDSSDTNFSGSQPKTRQTQQPPQQQQQQQTQQQQQEQQLSVTDSPAPGLPYQTSSAKENQAQPSAAEESTDTPTKSTKKPQSQLQPPQQHLLKPVVNKQVSLTSISTTIWRVNTIQHGKNINSNIFKSIINSHSNKTSYFGHFYYWLLQ